LQSYAKHLFLLLGGIETLLFGGLGGALLTLLNKPLDFASGMGLLVVTVGDDLVDFTVTDVALALHTLRGDKTLDFRGLRGLALTLAANDVLAHIVVLGQAEELADLGGALRSQAAGLLLIGETGNVSITLLDDGELQNREIVTSEGTTHGLTLAGTLAALAESLHALGEKETNAVCRQDTLHHRESLFVVAARDAQNVSLELGIEDAAIHFLAHALVHERLDDTVRLFVNDLDLTRRRVGNTELHGSKMCEM